MSAFVTVLHATHSNATLLYAVNSRSVVKRAQHKSNPPQERIVHVFAADDNVLVHGPRSAKVEIRQTLRRRCDFSGESVDLPALHSAQVAVEVGTVAAEGAISLQFSKCFL